MFDALESRTFLSAALSSTGVLTVAGMPADDTIYFYAEDNKLAVSDDGVIRTFDPAVIKRIIVHGGDGNDSISLGTRKFKTAIYGDNGNDTLSGGPGKDTLYGGDGDDHLNGKAGRDNLRGGLGSDLMFGGDGIDTADYIDRTDAITVSIGGGYNDGAPSEHDNVVADVENLRGSQGDSVLIGNGAPNFIESGYSGKAHGNHVTLRGMGGDDTLNSHAWAAALYGGDGNDDLYSEGSGVLVGGGGNDLLYAIGFGFNQFDGGDGQDIASGGFTGFYRDDEIDFRKSTVTNVEKIRDWDFLPHFLLSAERFWASIGGR